MFEKGSDKEFNGEWKGEKRMGREGREGKEGKGRKGK